MSEFDKNWYTLTFWPKDPSGVWGIFPKKNWAGLLCSMHVIFWLLYLNKAGKKVCKTTAVRCFSYRLVLRPKSGLTRGWRRRNCRVVSCELLQTDLGKKVIDGEQTWSGMSPSSSVVEVVFGVSIDSRSFLRSDLKRVFSISRSCN